MEIIGDHSEAFSFTREVVAPMAAMILSVVLTFTASLKAAPALRAQFRMSKPLTQADGTLTDDEAGAFEIGLITQASCRSRAQLVIVDPLGAGELASGPRWISGPSTKTPKSGAHCSSSTTAALPSPSH